MPRITAKDCKVTIAVALAFAALIAVKTFHLSSFVVPNEFISYTPNLDTSKWSEAMLRASRSRLNLAEQNEPRRRQLQVVQDGSPAKVKQITKSHTSSSGEEIIVDILSTPFPELVSLFLNHKFKGVLLYHKSELDRV